MGGNWYAFAGPVGVICVINKTSGSYGCSGALPGAPDGANLVSAGPFGPPSFTSTGQPIFGAIGEAKPLPPNTRLSYRDISCGVDGAGVVACVNGHDQVGFVVSPTGTFINDLNPMLDRPEGTSPYLPGMPEPYAGHEGERVIYGQRLLQAVGSDKVIRTARSLGITAPMVEDPAPSTRVPASIRCSCT
jgi:hypothetical protein